MKKLIAILILLAMCLAGCAEAQRPERTPEAPKRPEASEAPEITEAPEEKKVVLTDDVTELLKQAYTGDYEPIEEEMKVAMNERLALYGRALYLILELEDTKLEDTWQPLFRRYQSLLIAWVLAEHEPSVQAEHDGNTVTIYRQDFSDYYELLFGEKPDINLLPKLSGDWCNFEFREGKLVAHYTDEITDIPPVIKVESMTYCEEYDEAEDRNYELYTLSANILLDQEAYVEDGEECYRLGTSHAAYADPAITEYPDEAVAAGIEFCWEKSGSGYILDSFYLSARGTEEPEEEENLEKYYGTTLFEALDQMPVNEEPSYEQMIAMQYALSCNDQIFLSVMNLHSDKMKTDHNYLSELSAKVNFVWHCAAFSGCLNGEKDDGEYPRVEGEGYFTTTAQELKSYSDLFLGEVIDAASLEQTPVNSYGTSALPEPWDGYLTARVNIGYGGSVLKNPKLTYDEAKDEYTLIADICIKQEYDEYQQDYSVMPVSWKFNEVLTLPGELLPGVLNVGMKKTDNGYQFTSIVVTEPSVRTVEQTEANMELNIFLTYLSAQSFGTYDPEARPELLDFAYYFAMRGEDPSLPVGSDGTGDYYYISEETVDRILNRFFGQTIRHGEVHRKSVGGSMYYFRNGKYYREWTMGSSNDAITITGAMEDNGDGTFRVPFGTFAVSYEETSYNHLTLAEAMMHPELRHVGNGVATVRPVGDTYQVVSYQIIGDLDL